ncbi:toll-like receptor 13 [Neoarius graeffei]|uniref:toll-like receptor 13 n=1 Tax=Neoarius graeffei TaxID=443677 RepID=UPI00298C9951|nr:toll-like receptor 13 [Neoarius graeffei]
MQFFSSAVFTNLLMCVLSWVSEKCLVYEGYLNDIIVGDCPNSNLTANCRDVSNIALDLARIPPHLEVLCLQLIKDSSLHPSSFSRFQKLRHLQIAGAISTVVPGAFKNLLNLQRLEINCLKSFNLSFSSEILSDLQNITTLTFQNCRLSSMAVDLFKGLTKLEKLIFVNNIEDFSDLLCRLTFASSSLQYLSVFSDSCVILRQPNCTFSNGTSFDVKEIHGIEKVSLYLGKVRVLDEMALKYFKKIFFLAIEFTAFEVLKFGIAKVNELLLHYYNQKLSSFEEICEIVHEQLVTALSISFLHASDSFVPNLDKCTWLESFDMNAVTSQAQSLNLTFINVLKNLVKLSIHWRISPESKVQDQALALCENQSSLVTKLKNVTLQTTNFRTLSDRYFSCLRELEELKWLSSDIEYIEDFTFNRTSLLKTLDLSSNKISQLTKYSLFGLSNLKKLVINENMLLMIDAVALLHLTSVEFVSLGVFQYPSSEPSTIQINLSIPENLKELYISSGIKPMSLILSSSRKPEAGLSLHVCGQSVTFQDCDNPLFQSLIQLTAETEQLFCGQSFPARYLKSLRRLMIKANHKTAQMDLTDLKRLVNLKSLILFNVDLSHQSGLDALFHNLSNLEYLHMSFCSVPLLEKDLSRDLQSLKVLFLHTNDVFSMMENFVEPLKNLRYLIVQHAVLRCSCDNAWFTNWAKYQQSVQVYFLEGSLEKLLCKTADGTKFLHKYAQDYCFIDVGFLLFTCTSLGLVFFMFVVLLHQLAGDYLLAFFHIARAWVEEAMRANKKGHYHFDVFVSYCGKDERWVVDELLPNLEKRGPPFLRLCLHSRDFELGKDIVENITDSLYRSRHTLCLVSRNYLRSNWCSLEMRLATYRLLVEHRDVLVLVFLEKVPHRVLNVHHRLYQLVKTRTYIDWPQDPALHNAFWDRLWTKLAPKSAT